MTDDARRRLAEACERIFTPLRRQASPPEVVRAYAREADHVVRLLWKEPVDAHGLHDKACVVALGGYGRGELCPGSDIDVLVLVREAGDKDRVAAFVRALWDSVRSVGCVVRTMVECQKILGDDLATDMAFLEATWVAGNSDLYHRLVVDVVKPHFRKRKRWYLDELRRALSDGVYSSANTLYRVEPDVKNGICGLRDVQRILWGERIVTGTIGGNRTVTPAILGEEEQNQLKLAYHFLLGIRIELHMLSGRRMDVLEVGMQDRVSRALGEDGAGALMERYYRAVAAVHRGALLFLENSTHGEGMWNKVRQAASSFPVGPGLSVVDGLLYARGNGAPGHEEPAVWLMQVFQTAISSHAALSTELRAVIRGIIVSLTPADFRSPEVYGAFREILADHRHVGRILQLMHETGCLEAIVPEFAPLRCKVEYDSYHEYTVDQHVLLALRALDDIAHDKDERVAGIYLNLEHRLPLRLALLLHDVGKGLPGDHATTGAVMAESIADRLGLSEHDRERVRFLVYHHLDMSETSFLREPEAPVVSYLARTVGDRETLDMLYLLTVLDIRHVGSRAWTGWKAVQLEDIYLRTAAELDRLAGAPQATSTEIGYGSDDYLREMLPEEQLRHRRWLDDLRPSEIQLHRESFLGFERVTVLAHDRPDFLADFVACLVSEGLRVLAARVYSPPDGRVLDVFDVEPDGTTQVPLEQRFAQVEGKWRQLGKGEIDPHDLVRERFRTYAPRPVRASSQEIRVAASNEVSRQFTVLEVDAPDSFGLLHTLVNGISELGINIVSAKIATRVDRAVDVFYLCGTDGGQVGNNDLLTRLREELSTMVRSHLAGGR